MSVPLCETIAAGSLLVTKGPKAARFERLAGTLSAEWTYPLLEGNPLHEFAVALEKLGSPLAEHWIFGGEAATEGYEVVELSGKVDQPCRSWGIQIYNTEREKALVSVQPVEQIRDRAKPSYKYFWENIASQWPIGILVKDAAGVYQFANARAAQSLGLPIERIIGRMDSEVFAPAHLPFVRETDRQVTALKKPATFTLKPADARLGKTLEVTKFPVRTEDDSVTFICAFVSEVSVPSGEELRTLSDQTALITSHRDFISMVSHELRTPLTAIQGAHFLMQKKAAGFNDERFLRYLALQAESITALKDLVDQVLFLNRIEHNSSQFPVEPMAINEKLHSILGKFNETTIGDHERIVFETSVPDSLQIDLCEPLFRAAIENLVSNALKYSPAARNVEI